jgi:hemolysin activation/secretion protein
VLLFAADAMSAAAQLCETLTEKMKQQQEQQQKQQQRQRRWQQPRQQHHRCQPGDQQQQQQRGQLPVNQQVELHNILNSLALSALHMWLLLFDALAAAPHCTYIAASSSSAAAAAAAPPAGS